MNSLTLLSGGLAGLQTTLINSWIGPAFLLVVAALSISFVVKRQFRELASFLAISAVVALLVFAGSEVFGSGGWFTNLAKKGAKEVGSTGNFISLFRTFW